MMVHFISVVRMRYVWFVQNVLFVRVIDQRQDNGNLWSTACPPWPWHGMDDPPRPHGSMRSVVVRPLLSELEWTLREATWHCTKGNDWSYTGVVILSCRHVEGKMISLGVHSLSTCTCPCAVSSCVACVANPCHHASLCAICLTSYLKAYGDTKPCPMCKEDVIFIQMLTVGLVLERDHSGRAASEARSVPTVFEGAALGDACATSDDGGRSLQ